MQFFHRNIFKIIAMIIPSNKTIRFKGLVLALMIMVTCSSGYYQNEERLCKRIRCGNEVSRKICPSKCRSRSRSIKTHPRPVRMGDDKMCLKHADCPKTLPVCMPGPFTKELLSNDEQKDIFFVGRCKSLKCSTDADCKERVAGTMLMHAKMRCINKNKENKKENHGLCVQNNKG